MQEVNNKEKNENKFHNGIYYEVHGDKNKHKPPIVLIHGFGFNSQIWQNQIEDLLEKGHMVVTYDVRGFGQSSEPEQEYSDCQDLHLLLTHLEIAPLKPIIVGHSAGGEIAVEYALEHKDKTGGLLLISPALNGVEGDNREFDEIAKLWKDGEDDKAREKMKNHKIFKDMADGPRNLCMGMIDKYNGCHFKNNLSKGIKSSERIRELKSTETTKGIRTLVIIGEHDEKVQEAVRETYENEGIPTKVMNDVGHMSFLEKPTEISEIIHNFAENKNEKEEVVEANICKPPIN